jgi:hypothetical protein
MLRVERMFVPRRLVVGAAFFGCLLAAAPPAIAQNTPQFVAQSVSPQGGYYGACGNDMPVGVTVRANLDSPLSLLVTLSYRYVSIDPKVPPSSLLHARMPLFSAATYAAAIDVSSEAPAFLKGGDGTLQYMIEAKNPNGDLAQSGLTSIGIRHCANPNSVAAHPIVKGDR